MNRLEALKISSAVLVEGVFEAHDSMGEEFIELRDSSQAALRLLSKYAKKFEEESTKKESAANEILKSIEDVPSVDEMLSEEFPKDTKAKEAVKKFDIKDDLLKGLDMPDSLLDLLDIPDKVSSKPKPKPKPKHKPKPIFKPKPEIVHRTTLPKELEVDLDLLLLTGDPVDPLDIENFSDVYRVSEESIISYINSKGA